MEIENTAFNRNLRIVLSVMFAATLAGFAYIEFAANPERPAWWMILINLLILAIPFGLIYGSIYVLVVGFREHSRSGKINPKMGKIIHWAPRAAGILIIFFISLFSLDVFDMPGTFLQKLGGLLMHNIPSIAMLVILLIAWKRPVVGFVAFLVAAAVFAGFFVRSVFSANLVIFVLPILLIAALFYGDWKWNKIPLPVPEPLV